VAHQSPKLGMFATTARGAHSPYTECEPNHRLWVKRTNVANWHMGHSMSSELNFQHSDPRMKLSIREAKIMNSFVDFFKILKSRFF
jgi:hypothetical protein